VPELASSIPVRRVSGVSLVFFQSSAGLCCGSAGASGLKMCTRYDCTTTSHTRVALVPAWEGATICRMVSATSQDVHIAPVLSVKDLPQPAIESLLARSFTADGWAAEVALQEAALATKARPDLLKIELATARKAYKTPARARGSSTNLERKFGAFTDLDMRSHVIAMPRVSEKLEEAEENAWNDSDELAELSPTAILKLLAVKTDAIGDLALESQSKLEADYEETAKDIKSLNSITSTCRVDINQLFSQLGMRGANIPESESSVWGALSNVQDIIDGTGLSWLYSKGLSFKSGSFINDIVMKATDAVLNAEPLVKLSTNFHGQIVNLMSKVKTLESAPPVAFQPQTGVDTGPLLARLDLDFDEPRAPRIVDGVLRPSNEFLSESTLTQVHQLLAERVASLERQVSGSGSVGDMVVNFRDQIFHTEHECGAYLMKHLGRDQVPPRFMTDAYTLFNAMRSDMYPQAVGIKEIHVLSQMGDNIHEADVHNAAAANHTGVPSWFHGSSKSVSVYTGTGKEIQFKGGAATHESWGEPGAIDGMKYKALKSLGVVVTAIRYDTGQEIRNPTIRAFLESMQERSQAFIAAIFSYTTDAFFELQSTFKDKTVTWDFVYSCVEHIFTHEFDVARSILRGHDVKAAGFNQIMMWTCLRTVVVQETFLAVGIANHPSLSGAYC